MSTRCQVIVKDDYESVWFYRHSDGYPEGTLPSLNEFLDLVKEGKIRDNASQASGWLVLIGAKEYGVSYPQADTKGDGMDWKVGAYEPCSAEKHGDIEYLYTVDLDKKEITYETL